MRRTAALLAPLVLAGTLFTAGCGGPEDNPVTTIENAGEGNVGGMTPQDLKDGAEQYQTDLSGLDGLEESSASSAP